METLSSRRVCRICSKPQSNLGRHMKERHQKQQCPFCLKPASSRHLCKARHDGAGVKSESSAQSDSPSSASPSIPPYDPRTAPDYRSGRANVFGGSVQIDSDDDRKPLKLYCYLQFVEIHKIDPLRVFCVFLQEFRTWSATDLKQRRNKLIRSGDQCEINASYEYLNEVLTAISNSSMDWSTWLYGIDLEKFDAHSPRDNPHGSESPIQDPRPYSQRENLYQSDSPVSPHDPGKGQQHPGLPTPAHRGIKSNTPIKHGSKRSLPDAFDEAIQLLDAEKARRSAQTLVDKASKATADAIREVRAAKASQHYNIAKLVSYQEDLEDTKTKINDCEQDIQCGEDRIAQALASQQKAMEEYERLHVLLRTLTSETPSIEREQEAKLEKLLSLAEGLYTRPEV